MSGALLAAGLGGAAGLGLSLRFNWWRRRLSGTPILMYHQVGAPRSGSALNKWRVKEEDFHCQLDALVRRGYRGVALRELLEAPPAGRRRAVLTFDDGYRGVLTRALGRGQLKFGRSNSDFDDKYLCMQGDHTGSTRVTYCRKRPSRLGTSLE